MSRLLFVGSSIFEAWAGVAGVAPGHVVINRAVGGTTTRDWVARLPAVLESEAPGAVGLYAGSNDLNNNVPAGVILENLSRCRALVGALPLAYFGIIKAPQKEGRWELIDELNCRAAVLLRGTDLYADPNDIYFRDGRPVGAYFLEDGLHLTPEAYARMTDWARPLVLRWLGAA
ncbi:MAG: hypothetical protein KA248_00860 [Kiritimatiellae bacterium]|nr:hypothetical protein [Kiritimatiellia bacterium]